MEGIYSGYMTRAFRPDIFSKIIVESLRVLRPHSKEFDAIAFRGFSGSMLGPILAFALKKKMIIVRKEKEPSHGSSIEGARCNRYIIVDDFIAGGMTVRTIISKIAASTIGGIPVGIFLWNHSTNTTGTFEGLPVWKTSQEVRDFGTKDGGYN